MKNKPLMNLIIGLLLVMAVPLVVCTAGAQSSKKQIVWIYSSMDFKAIAPVNYMNYEMPDVVAKATNGRLKIEYRPGLYGQADRLAPLAENKIQIGWINPARYSGTHPEWEVTHLPFFIETLDAYYKFFDGPGYDLYFTKIFKKYNENLTSPVWYSVGSDALWSKKPVISIDDFKGLKISASSLARTAVGLLRGSAVAIQAAELYLALDRGVIDGVLYAPNAGVSLGLNKICKNYSNWPLIANYPYTIMVNTVALNGLPADVKRQFLDTMTKVIQPRCRELATKDISAFGPAHMKTLGVTWTDPSQAELARAREMVKPMIVDWSKKSPECLALIKAFEKMTGRKFL